MIKKTIFALLCAVGMTAMAEIEPVTTVDVYDFKATVAMPRLVSGVRNYKTVVWKGKLYIEYVGRSSIVDARLDFENTTTKVKHSVYLDEDAVYRMVGKSKTINSKLGVIAERTVPNFYFSGTNDVTGPVVSHERIEKINLAGRGLCSYTYSSKSSVCCGISGVEFCQKAKSINGKLTGLMSCECGDEQNHTLVMGACLPLDGVLVKFLGDEMSEFDGSWYARYNAKESYTVDAPL